MTRLLALAVLLVAATPALAGDAPEMLVKAPAEWTLTSAPQPLADESDLGTPVTAAFRPAAGGAILYVTRREIAADAANRDRIATAELGVLTAELNRAGTGIAIDSSSTRADRAHQQLESLVSWRDTGASVMTSGRTIVAANDSTIVAVTGECVIAMPGDATACEAALGTLHIDLADEVRIALAILTAPEDPAAPAVAPQIGSSAPEAPPVTPSKTSTSSTMTDARPGLTPIVVAPAPPPPKDLRTIYLGLGLVVFAALLYWNKRRRERFEREDGRPLRRRERKRDDDADALQAAAAETDTKDTDP